MVSFFSLLLNSSLLWSWKGKYVSFIFNFRSSGESCIWFLNSHFLFSHFSHNASSIISYRFPLPPTHVHTRTHIRTPSRTHIHTIIIFTGISRPWVKKAGEENWFIPYPVLVQNNQDLASNKSHWGNNIQPSTKRPLSQAVIKDVFYAEGISA